jgi:uridine kinase
MLFDVDSRPVNSGLRCLRIYFIDMDELNTEEILAEIQRLRAIRSGPIIIALDGGSGAGKSTLASLIKNEVGAALIPLDDFFSANIPDSQWDRFSVEERLNHVFDWRRLREEALEPLLAGKAAKWHPFDFQSGLRPDGTYGMKAEPVERKPTDVILIEGAYSAHPALADLIDLSILVDVPIEERHARLVVREGKDFLAKWHGRWDSVENYYFNRVRPRNSYDLILRLVSRT